MLSEIQPIYDFLACKTPKEWLERAIVQLDLVLIDHAHCEKKAAFSALAMINRYAEHPELLMRMSKLAREELRHFEQVLSLLKKRGVAFCHLSAGRYAQGLRQHIRKGELERLIDNLIIGAIIEARSCERFAALLPYLQSIEPEIAKFYQGLLASEARHFQIYLQFVQQVSGSKRDIQPEVERLLAVEADLILSPDDTFRFHSGVPIAF